MMSTVGAEDEHDTGAAPVLVTRWGERHGSFFTFGNNQMSAKGINGSFTSTTPL
jgi:hypothetical protein